MSDPKIPPSSEPSFDAEWNAGGLGCGELVLELMLRLRKLAPGQVLRLTATDPGAPADIPAWCRMTGHILKQVEADGQIFFIQRN